ncbi:Ion transport protein-domain-containing protein [Pelagophyceae sp. CCMP2097]|nr:Ion transport protein-domain-containing protein [Pelagophyceae sp. CCMP2097]
MGVRRRRVSRMRLLADSPELDQFILLVILFNCVTMAFPPKQLNATRDNPQSFFFIADYVLIGIFDLEFFVKFWAYGFAYFSDAWNWLDFLVVFQGNLQVLTALPGNIQALEIADLSALRMMRVLRPLKSLRKFPEMRLLVGSLFGSFNLLLAIMALTAMAIFIFATYAYLYFGDALDYRCVPDPYYDPFTGVFTSFPGYNSSLEAPYWTSRAQYAAHEAPAADNGAGTAWGGWGATQFWDSFAKYGDARRDDAPSIQEFPYLSSFCGECKTCRRCEKCYSDNPADGCGKSMPAFYRRYGNYSHIQHLFWNVASGEVLPRVPYPQDGYERNINPAGVKYIQEYCVDMKKVDGVNGAHDKDFGGRLDYRTPLGKKAFSGLVLRRRTDKLDLKDPKHNATKLRYQAARCFGRNKKRTNYLRRSGTKLKDCKPKKTGTFRDGIQGRSYPRRENLRWYLRFDRSLWALLSVFDVMNMENWNDVMWSIQMATGKYTWPFFYGIVGLVNICLLNLFPAVMSFNLRSAIREEENRISYEAKAQFMGEEMLAMTAFEEHMIDILAAEEEEMIAMKRCVELRVPADVALRQQRGPAVDALEGMPGVPGYPGAATLRAIVRPETGIFNIFIYLCIVANIILMATQTLRVESREGKKHVEAILVLNTFFVMVFLSEIAIKLLALGGPGYFVDAYNVFDFVLGVLGAVDVVAGFVEGSSLLGGRNIFGVLRVIRMFRIARVLRIATIAKVSRASTMTASQLNFSRLMGILAMAAIWVANVLGLLLLCLYMASIVAMQFFGGEVYALNDYSQSWTTKGRLNFDSFSMAMLTNFIILTADNWSEIMYTTMDSSGVGAAIFFLVLFVVGRYAILSMLIAVVFDQVERDSILVLKKAAQTTMVSVFKFEHALQRYVLRFHFLRWYLASRSQFIEQEKGGGGKMGQITLPPPPPAPLTSWQKFMAGPDSYGLFPPESAPRRFCAAVAHSATFANVIFLTIMTSVVVLAQYYQYRNRASRSTTLEAVARRHPRLQGVQYLCMSIFISEFVLCSIADGLFNFLADPLNVVDTAVTAISIIALGVPLLTAFSVIRMIRIIRPLKKFARSSPAVMSILIALENSSQGLAAVGLIAVFTWATVAIVGLQLFQGALFYCSAARYPEGMLLKAYGPDQDNFKGTHKYDDWPNFAFRKRNVTFPPSRQLNNSQGCQVNFDLDYPLYNRAANVVEGHGSFNIVKSDYNFDNFYEALKSAFVVFTFDDWYKLALQTTNAKTTGPYHNHEAEASTILPTIFFLVAGCSSFLITVLFVGVIYGTFTYNMLTSMHARLASLKQAQWTVYEAKLDSVKAIQEPQEPRSNLILTRVLFRVFRHPNYKVVYSLALMVDVSLWWIYCGSQVRISPKHAFETDVANDPSNKKFLEGCRNADTIFAAALLGEFVVKLFVFGGLRSLCRRAEQLKILLLLPVALYVALEASDSWDSLEDLDPTGSSGGGTLQKALYGLRTTQVLLVVPHFVEMQMVVRALYSALGTTVPMVLLMTMVTFAFAVIGMVLFGNADLPKHDGFGMREPFGTYWNVARIRFTTVSKSMNVLFIAATANNWTAVRDKMAPGLDPLLRPVLNIFWVAYILLVRFLFLNVCTLIFIYQYEASSPLQPWIAMQQVDEFLQAWQHFDEFGVGRVRTKYLSRLLRLLAPPLGLARDAPQQLADRHARRVLMAMPPMMEKEVATGMVDEAARWAQVRKPFYSRGGAASGEKDEEAVATASLLPRYLEFGHVIKAVHKVVMFPELQTLPDDGDLAARRDFAQAKLDVLRLAVNRFCEPGNRAVDAAGNRVPAAVDDASLMQRSRPQVYRYRLRQALTLEVYRWARQIELGVFDEEAFHECELLRAGVAEERLSSQMQLEVLNRMAERGLLMAMQERRPKLQRHIFFLTNLLTRVEGVRAKHVRKAWQEKSMEHCGTLPVCPRAVPGGPAKRAVSSISTSASGDLVVVAHGGSTVSVWKRRKERRADPYADREGKAKDAASKADPWMYTPYFKTQCFTEDLGTALVVCMSPDGKRFFSSAGEKIRGWLVAKKQHDGKGGTNFFCESIMAGHSLAVNALRIAHRHLFSVADDGCVKIWRLRASDAQQSASLTTFSRALSLCCMNTARPSSTKRDDLYGLAALVGMEDGMLHVLPYSLKQQWLQGAVWRPTLGVEAFPKVPVTAVAFEYRNVYCGSATGSIAVYRAVAGMEDLATLEATAKALEQMGFGSDAAAFQRATSTEAGAKLVQSLQHVVRLDPLYSLAAHADAVTGFCAGGGVFFSVALDMAVVSWKKPRDAVLAAAGGPVVGADAIAPLGGAAQLRSRVEKPMQEYGHARVIHKAPVTACAISNDFLFTADADGFVVVSRAAKFREVIQSARANKEQPKRLAEEEVLEKPRFFRQLDVAAMTPRLFLASVLAHYYPIRQLKKDRQKQRMEEAEEGQDHKDDKDDSDEDDEALDDSFVGDDLWGGGEDQAGEDEPAFGEDEDDEDDEDEGDEDSDDSGDEAAAPEPPEQEPEGFLSYLFGSETAKPDAVVVPRGGRAADSDSDSYDSDDSDDYSDEDDEESDDAAPPPR